MLRSKGSGGGALAHLSQHISGAGTVLWVGVMGVSSIAGVLGRSVVVARVHGVGVSALALTRVVFETELETASFVVFDRFQPASPLADTYIESRPEFRKVCELEKWFTACRSEDVPWSSQPPRIGRRCA